MHQRKGTLPGRHPQSPEENQTILAYTVSENGHNHSLHAQVTPPTHESPAPSANHRGRLKLDSAAKQPQTWTAPMHPPQLGCRHCRVSPNCNGVQVALDRHLTTTTKCGPYRTRPDHTLIGCVSSVLHVPVKPFHPAALGGQPRRQLLDNFRCHRLNRNMTSRRLPTAETRAK